MKEYTVHDVQSELRAHGYLLLRRRGSHQMWSNGKNSIAIPVLKMNRALAARLIKEIRRGDETVTHGREGE